MFFYIIYGIIHHSTLGFYIYALLYGAFHLKHSWRYRLMLILTIISIMAMIYSYLSITLSNRVNSSPFRYLNTNLVKALKSEKVTDETLIEILTESNRKTIHSKLIKLEENL